MNESAFELLSYLKQDEKKTMYFDRKYTGTESDYFRELFTSGTLYIGSLSKKIREFQIYMLFSQCGRLQRVIMGLDSKKYTPCGFAFVEYANAEFSLKAKRFFSNYWLESMPIHIDLDSGFSENRQFGRGFLGRQAKEDYMRPKRKRRHV